MKPISAVWIIALALTAAVWSACDEANSPTFAVTDAGHGSSPTANVLPAPAPTARANAATQATDHVGRGFHIEYQPDWVRKVTLTSHAGHTPSTTLLFRNDGYRLQDPGPVVRTRIASPDHGLDFEVAINDPGRVIKRIIVETVPADGSFDGEPMAFTIEDILPPPDDDDDS